MPRALVAYATQAVGRFFSDNPLQAALETLVNLPAMTFHAAWRQLHPDQPESPTFTQTLAAGTFTVRQPISYHQWIYGQVRAGGAITFLEDDANDPGVLHMIVTFTGHPVEEMGAVYLNDEEVPLDGDGLATSGPYNKGSTQNHVETLSVAWTATGDVTVAHTVASVNSVSVVLENGETLQLTDVSPATPELFGQYKRSGDTFSFAPRPDGIAWLAGSQLTVDYQETVTTSWVTIQKSKGDEAEGVQPFPDLAAASASWTAAHLQTGRAKLYLRLEYSPDAFPTGIPNVSCLIKGRKVVDYRGSPTERAYSANWALCVADYLMETSIGLGCSVDEIDLAELAAAANTCDEDVELPGSPTLTEKRYEMHGGFGADLAPREVLQRMMTGAHGNLRYIGGKWLVQPGVYRVPAGDTLDQDDLRGPVKILPRLSRRDLCNTVRGLYRAPGNNWQPTDFPPVASSTYIAQDSGEVLPRELDLPFVKSPYQAQRVASIELETSRQQITVEWPGKLTCYQFKPGSTVQVTVARYGWSAKVFEVVSTTLVREGAALIGCDLLLRETAAGVFTSPTLSVVDLAPDTDLPSPFDADAPTDLAFDQADWQLTGEGELAWTAVGPYNASFHVQYKRKGDAAWKSVPMVPGTESTKRFTGLKPGPYRFRARSVNQLGVSSAWSAILDQTLTPPAVPNINGLRLRPATGTAGSSSHIFTGRDAKFEWRAVSTQSAYDIGGEPIGNDTGAGSGAAGQGDVDPFFKDYKIEIWDVDATTRAETGTQPVRPPEFRTTPEYTYTWEKNAEDHAGTPVRIAKIKVRGRDKFGNESARAAQFTFRNEAPAIDESTVTLTAVPGGFSYALTLPSDPDVLGVKVYASLTSGFTPGASTLVANKRFQHGQGIADQVGGLAKGVTYYVKLVPYDVFGDGTTSSKFSFTTQLEVDDGGESDGQGQLGIIASLGITAWSSVLGFTPPNSFLNAPSYTKPTFIPAAAALFIAAKHPTTERLWLALIDPKTMAAINVVDSGITVAGASSAVLMPTAVWVAKTGRIYLSVFDGTNAKIYKVNPATLGITLVDSSLTKATALLAVFPQAGTILCGTDNAGGTALELREYDAVNASMGSSYALAASSDGVSTYAYETPMWACYAPGGDRWFIGTPGDQLIHVVPRGLGSEATVSMVTAFARCYGMFYCPTDDRVWAVIVGAISNTLRIYTTAGVLDTTLSPPGVLARACFCPASDLVSCLSLSGDLQSRYYTAANPNTHSLNTGSGVAETTGSAYPSIDYLMYAGGAKRFFTSASDGTANGTGLERFSV